MKGVAISPLVAVVIVLVGIAYTVYVFEQDSGLASGITKEGEIKKAIAQMDKDLDKIPGIADDVLIENQHEFKDDPYIENEIASKVQSQLGFRPTVKITGGDWASTQIRITVPHYSVSVGDTTTTVDNLTRGYSLEAPRPHELFELYNNFNPSIASSCVEADPACTSCTCYHTITVNNTTIKVCDGDTWDYYRYITGDCVANKIHDNFGMGRLIVNVTLTAPNYDNTKACEIHWKCTTCGKECRLGEITFTIRVFDLKNQFVDFFLINKMTGEDKFSYYDH